MVTDLWQDFLTRFPKFWGFSVDQIRKVRRKFSREPKYRQFSEHYPTIFERILDSATTEKEIAAIYFMLDLKSAQNSGKIQDGQAKLQEYVMNTFSMSKKEYTKKHPDSKIMEVP